MLAVLMSAGAAALAFEITKLEAAYQRSAPADRDIDDAPAEFAG